MAYSKSQGLLVAADSKTGVVSGVWGFQQPRGPSGCGTAVVAERPWNDHTGGEFLQGPFGASGGSLFSALACNQVSSLCRPSLL